MRPNSTPNQRSGAAGTDRLRAIGAGGCLGEERAQDGRGVGKAPAACRPAVRGRRCSVTTRNRCGGKSDSSATSECRMFPSCWPGSDSLRTRRGIVRLCARRSFSLTGTPAVALVTEGCIPPAGSARQQIYQAQCAECHAQRWKAPPDRRWPESFPLELERASAGESRRQDQKTMPFSLPGPFRAAINRPRGRHSPASKFSAGPLELSDAIWRRLRSLRREPPRRPGRRPGASLPPRRQPCRADESHRFSEFEYHLQPSAQDPVPSRKRNRLLTFTMSNGIYRVSRVLASISRRASPRPRPSLDAPDSVSERQPSPGSRRLEAVCRGAREAESSSSAAHKNYDLVDISDKLTSVCELPQCIAQGASSSSSPMSVSSDDTHARFQSLRTLILCVSIARSARQPPAILMCAGIRCSY